MKTVVIVQARTGSTRLPRKVLRSLVGQTVLGHVIGRLNRCRLVDQIVIATTDQPEDIAIVNEGQRLQTTVVRGSENDVLARYHKAAHHVGADLIIRVTSDCPLIDPVLIDELIERFKHAWAHGEAVDYLSNVHPRSYAHGLDAELFTIQALDRAFTEATQTYEREHVTPYFYLNLDKFKVANQQQSADHSQLRWTLDEPDDWRFFETVFERLNHLDYIGTTDVLSLLKQHPEIQLLNAKVQQKSLKAA